MDRAVVLVSGGVNSAVITAIAREQYEPVLLHVGWNHRSADRELAAFEQLSAHFGIEKTLAAELPCMAAFGGNSRVSKRLSIEDANTLSQETPSTFAPGVLPSMLGLAAAWAGAIKARRIFVGISEGPGGTGPTLAQLYPDYRREFVQAFNLTLRYAFPAKQDILVDAPLVDLSRAEIVRLGLKCEVPYALTWSCYASGAKPCGRCLGCVNRALGFSKAGMADPLFLEPVGA
ncbi:MAG: 7-cyano-7-deazaguanine synthase [Phycisphaerae bacterium]|nr:7-cyano-7-deazaguanine synthase [Phycisphaerae bacterium]